MAASEARGVLDTCTLIDIDQLDRRNLPDIPEITSITMSELHQGLVFAKTAQARASRLERLSMVVDRFEPLAYDGEAASRYGTLATLTVGLGRSLKQRRLDLMIGAIASVHEIPLYTRNPADFKGLESVLRVIAV